jgi:hypothetical protein
MVTSSNIPRRKNKVFGISTVVKCPLFRQFLTLENSIMPTKQQFETRLAKLRKLNMELSEFRSKLSARYGAGYQSSWLTTGDRNQLDKLRIRESKASDIFFTTLDQVASRNWRHAIPVYWIIENINWEMATTRDQITPIPPIAWGHSGNNEIWSRPLTELVNY